MAIDYGNSEIFAFPKGKSRVVSKIERKRDAEKEERECRAAVDTRDKHKCFFPRCRKRANEKHHIVSSSVRGVRVWRTDDILSACTLHHSWFKAALIAVAGNPDNGPVAVSLTKLGEDAKIRIPPRAA